MLDLLSQYDVAWDSPSADASGSMPIGNGDLGANVWIEPTGELVLLLAKTDAWDENSTLLKLGRVRIKLDPNPLALGVRFVQTLRLRTATIEICVGGVSFRVWVDSHHPTIHVEIESSEPLRVSAEAEIWRDHEYPIKTQTGDLFKNLTGKDPFPTIVSPDHVLDRGLDRIVWCHHNQKREHDGFEINMRLQGLGGFLDRMPHPLLGRTFGAAVEGDGFLRSGPHSLRSASTGTSHRLSVHALTLHPSNVDSWAKLIDAIIDESRSLDRAQSLAAHSKWWESFWQRSWMFVSAPSSDEEARRATDVTRGYVLQRFMNACAGRAAQPIKFNGSIFSVGKPEDPDFRRWGGPGFWFQNVRLIYWPMLAGGDFDLLQPWIRMYRDMLPLQEHRTRAYFGHDGAHYPETIMFWGAEVSGHYGWTPFEQRSRPEAECSYLTYYWSGGIELVLLLWNFWRYTGDETLAREVLLPIADAVMRFFDSHYPRGGDGRIQFAPAQSLETWHEATNPTPEIAGLRYTLPKLLELPESLTNVEQRATWTRMLDELPAIPIGEKDGRQLILPAERFDKKKNTENPELYAVFPYRLYGVGKDQLQLARDTFAARLHQSHDCWSQDDVQMALLGLADEARDWVSKRASDASHSDSRFPGFWNAFHDWLPDMDHGGVLQLALQNMLMQCEGRQILLLPAWPREWDVRFRIHAPFNTVVECQVRDGDVVDLVVTPQSRRADVVFGKDRS